MEKDPNFSLSQPALLTFRVWARTKCNNYTTQRSTNTCFNSFLISPYKTSSSNTLQILYKVSFQWAMVKLCPDSSKLHFRTFSIYNNFPSNLLQHCTHYTINRKDSQKQGGGKEERKKNISISTDWSSFRWVRARYPLYAGSSSWMI